MATQTGELRFRVSAQDFASTVFKNISRQIITMASAYLSVKGVQMVMRQASAAIQDTVKGFVDYTSAVDQANKLTGMSTDSIQRLAYIAKREGTSIEQIAATMKFLVRNMAGVQAGAEGSVQAFAKIGVRATNADGSLRKMEDVFGDVCDVIAETTSETDALNIATQFFGKQGAAIIPVAKLGADEIRRLGDEAKRLGLVLDEDIIRQGDALGKTFTMIQEQMRGARLEIMEQLLPSMQEALPIFLDYLDFSVSMLKTYEPVFTMLNKAIQYFKGSQGEAENALSIIKGLRAEKDRAAREEEEKARKAEERRRAAQAAYLAETKTLEAWMSELSDGTEITRAEFFKLQEGVKEVVQVIPEFGKSVDGVTTSVQKGDEATDSFTKRYERMLEILRLVPDVNNDIKLKVDKVAAAQSIAMMHLQQFLGNEVIDGFHQLGWTITNYFTEPIMEAARASGDLFEMLKAIIAQKLIELPFKFLASFIPGGGFLFGNRGGLVPAFQAGGYVMGPGGRDKVMGGLTAGEYVLNDRAVQRIGVDNLNRLNSGDTFHNAVTVHVHVAGGGNAATGNAIARQLEAALPDIMKKVTRRRKV